MSIDEQNEAIVRLVKQRFEAKKRIALLENELQTAGRSLWEIGNSLKSVKASGTWNETPGCILPEIDKAPSICNLDRIKAMLQELKDLKNMLMDLNHRASESGID